MPASAEDLAIVRSAVDDFLRSAAACAGRWAEPRAPGKWSPAQIVEHVARSLEESAKDARGQPSKLPQLPGPVRFVARQFLFNRVVKTSRFPNARTSRAMNPEAGPATVEDGRRRVEDAWRALEAAALGVDRAQSHTFGDVSIGDYLRFQAEHTRHHGRQFPTG